MPPKKLWEAYSNRTELWEAYSNRTVRPSISQSVRPSRFRVRSISPIFFEVGIPNLVCGWIHLVMAECRVPFSGYCDFDLDL